MNVTHPDMLMERSCMGMVCGIDEAGRGPLAGPVYAASVILDEAHIPQGLRDSKQLSAHAREALAQQIQASALYGIGVATVDEIARLNILHATMLAMQRAFSALPSIPDHALIDGNKTPDLACNTHAVVKGDQRCLSIAAASILAKVARDAYMVALHHDYPEYGFAAHKGYGTKRHIQALRTYGPTQHHRQGFAPVARLLQTG